MIVFAMDSGTIVYIALIVASLCAGLLFGLWKRGFTARGQRVLAAAMGGMVLVLIFLMGLKTGLNRGVMDNLGRYGLNAALLALGAIAGSLVCVVAFDRLFPGGAGK